VEACKGKKRKVETENFSASEKVKHETKRGVSYVLVEDQLLKEQESLGAEGGEGIGRQSDHIRRLHEKVRVRS